MDAADTARSEESHAGSDTSDDPGGGTTGDTAGDPAGSEVNCAGRHDDDHVTGDVLSLLGKAYTTSIIYHLAHEDDRPWRFTELESAVEAPPNVLSTRLTQMVDAGLLDRQTYDEIPPRVEYRITDEGRELSPILFDLRAWADRHDVEMGESL